MDTNDFKNILEEFYKSIKMESLEKISNTIISINRVIEPHVSEINKTYQNISKMILETIQIDPLLKQAQEILNQPVDTAIKIKDEFSKIDFDSLNTFYTQMQDILTNININYHIKIDKHNENKPSEIISNVKAVTEEITENKNISSRQKKKWLIKFFELIKKYFAGIILPFLLFILQPMYDKVFNETPYQQIIYESLQEIEQIKNEEGITNELRVITKDTYIYKGKKLKQIIFKLQVGDIVEVLENNNKLLKVKEYQTGKIGWIRKKYTKC